MTVTQRTPDARNDEGSSLILIVFAGLLCAAIVLGVTAATSLYVERKRLFSIADAAALVGAESYDLNQVDVVDGHVVPRLDTSRVRSAVERFMSEGLSGDDHRTRIERAFTADGRSATVVLSAVWNPPLVSFFFPQGLRIDVESAARSVFSAR